MSVATLSGSTFRREAMLASDLFDDDIFVDLYAGAGGASLGIEDALNRCVDEAINHEVHAVEVHSLNHPHTRHHRRDIFDRECCPRKVAAGRRVGGLWASPDCTQFSRAKGAKPVKRNPRCLCWAIVMWAQQLPPDQRPRRIFMENVREFMDYGPLVAVGDAPDWRDEKGNVADLDNTAWVDGEIVRRRPEAPDKARNGSLFALFVESLKSLGYTVEWRVIDAADHGEATHRRRLFLIARLHGAVVWPEATHGPVTRAETGRRHSQGSDARDNGRRRGPGLADGGSRTRSRNHRDRGKAHADGRVDGADVPPLRPYRTAAECIDWSLPCPSIFDRKKPLAEKTQRRIAMGIWRYVLQAAGTAKGPFIVPVNHGDGWRRGGERVRSVERPAPTITGRAGEYVCVPSLATVGYSEREGQAPRVRSAEEPLTTITGQGRKAALASAMLVRHCQNGSNGSNTRPADAPLTTVCTKAEHSVVAATVIKHYEGMVGHLPERPLGTITAIDHHSVCGATLIGVGGAGYAGKPKPVDEPANTVMTNDRRAVASAVLVGVGGRAGCSAPREVDRPGATVTTKGDTAVTAAAMIRMNHGDKQWNGADEPLPTITGQGNKAGLVCALLIKYFGSALGAAIDGPLHTVTSKARFGLVTVQLQPAGPAETVVAVDLGPKRGGWFIIADIGLRMLTPRELARCQGFPDSYVLTGSQAQQIARIGNSVCPKVARALVAANCPDMVRRGDRRRKSA